MKTNVKFTIFLFFELVSIVYVFSFTFVDAAKLESGVTINAPPTTDTEKICDDTIDNDNDGKIDADDQDCAAAPTGPTAGTCGLQIVSGVPINYGELSPGALSANQAVIMKNEENSDMPGTVMIKGGDWIGDSAPNPIISGPEMTRIAGPGTTFLEELPPGIGIAPWEQKLALKSSGSEIGYIRPGEHLGINFQIKVPSSGISGSFHQEITIDLIC